MRITFDKMMGRTIRQAARVWLRTWLEQGIPVETGMALHAMEPMARILRVSLSNNAYGTRAVRKPYWNATEGATASPSSGAKMSSFVILDDKTNRGAFSYGFEWSTEILHYYFSEFYHGNAMPGDQVIRLAEAAFIDYVNDRILRDFPNIGDYLDFGTK